MEKEWKTPVVWQMMGYMRIPAPTAEEALKRAHTMAKNCPLPDNGQYLEDSFEIDSEGEPIEIREEKARTQTAPKYEFTGATKTIEHDDGHKTTVHRIQAAKVFGTVRPGDLGGWIENEENLSHGGLCWVSEDGCVCGSAKVYENARVFGHALVDGNARISGNATVCGFSHVKDQAYVTDRAVITDQAVVEGNALIYGYAELSKKAHVSDFAQVYGREKITGVLNGHPRKGKGAFEKIVLNATDRAGLNATISEKIPTLSEKDR